MKIISLLFLLITFCGYAEETALRSYLREIHLEHLNSGLTKVDCLYVINLLKRPEKWARTRNILWQCGLRPNRVNAINGWEELGAYDLQILSGMYPVRLRAGQVGCLLSHISVLQDANKRGFNVIWVMEDDIEIKENIHLIPPLLDFLDHFDPDWDVFYTDIDSKDLDGNRVISLSSDFRPDVIYPPLEYFVSQVEVHPLIKKIGQRFGAYSLLISKKGIKKILDYFTKVPLYTSYDIDIHYVPNIHEYSATRDLVTLWCGSKISDTNFK